MLREEVLGNPAEIEYISVTNGDIGGEIEAEAIVKGMRDIILQRHIILVQVVDDKHKLIGLVGRPDILKQNLNEKFVTITERRND